MPSKILSGSFIFLLLLFSLSFVITSSARAADYYVSPSGDDGALGTIDEPWETLDKAGNSAVAGDTVYIRSGTYNERLTPNNSGSPGQYITFTNYNNEDVLIDAQNGTRNSGVYIVGKSYVQIIGLQVTGANNYNNSPRSGVFVGDGSSYITVDGVTAYNNWYGIRLYGNAVAVTNVTVKNCKTFIHNVGPDTYTGNTQHGIFIYREVYDSTIGPNNRSAYNTGMGDSYGIEVGTADADNQTRSPQRIIIDGNETDHNEVQGIRTWNASDVQIINNHSHDNGASGIQLEGGARNIVVENNLSENNSQIYEYETGAWAADATNVLFRGNTLRSNKIGLIITNSSQVTAHHNYIYDNNRGAVNLINAGGLVVNNNVSNIYVTQNTLYNNGDPVGQRGGVAFGQTNAVCDNIKFINNIISTSTNPWDLYVNHCTNYTFNYNDYYNSRALSVNYLGSTIAWAAYLTASSQDSDTIAEDPLFSNTSADDYSLQISSPVIDNGTFLTGTAGSGTGTILSVLDAGYFSDGIFNAVGDVIKVASSEAVITDINYGTNTITLDRSLSWNSGDNVTFSYSGIAPDMGSYEYSPVPTPTPVTASTPVSSSGSNGSDVGYCSKQSPTSSPDLFQIDSGKNTAILYFAPAGMPYDSYNIAYGRSPDKPEYGVEFPQTPSSGVIRYQINALKPNTAYYFTIRAGNGCATGSFSNILRSKTTNNSLAVKKYYRFVSVSGFHFLRP